MIHAHAHYGMVMLKGHHTINLLGHLCIIYACTRTVATEIKFTCMYCKSTMYVATQACAAYLLRSVSVHILL